jgi:hypothetical protein
LFYYSAFSPIPDAARALPLAAPPTVREHRLYQADWLMRFYGFTHDEIVPPSQVGMLALDMDPKLAWALAHRERFPVNLNTAPRELLLRVPGFGVQTVERPPATHATPRPAVPASFWRKAAAATPAPSRPRPTRCRATGLSRPPSRCRPMRRSTTSAHLPALQWR